MLEQHKMHKIGVLYGLDDDKDARKICLRLQKKYGPEDGFLFVDFTQLNVKGRYIQTFSKLSNLTFGIHSDDTGSTDVDIGLEIGEDYVANDLVEHLKQNEIISKRVIPRDLWYSMGYPNNFGLVEIFSNKGVFDKFEKLLLESLKFIHDGNLKK